MKNIVIIGGNATGMSAATRLSRINNEDNIILYEKSGIVSYSTCSMPFVLGKVIKDRNALIINTAKDIQNKYGVQVNINHEVIEIDKARKIITVKNRETLEEFEQEYDILVLALGTNPTIIPFEGIETAKNIFTLNKMDDLDKINDFILTNNPKKVAIVGAGPIGIECAENLNRIGVEATVLDLSKQILNAFDVDIAQIAEKEIIKHGVIINKTISIKEILDEGKRLLLTNGEYLETDMIILAIGVKPNVQLAKEAGLNISEKGGVIVDEYLLTSDSSIYAGGDMIEVTNRVNLEPTNVSFGGVANRQGRMIANSIMGDGRPYLGTLATGVVKVGDLIIASTGLSHKQAIKEGYDALVCHVIANNHSENFENSGEITYKLVFDRNTRRILGAQAIGKEGTEKRIDVTATALYYNGLVDDLINLDLCYAPQVNYTKDHVNIAGQIAQNILDEVFIPFYPKDIKRIVQTGTNIIDVRPAFMYNQCKCNIPNSINIPYTEIEDSLEMINFDHDIYITCNEGTTGYKTALFLKRNGFTNDIYNLSGGMKFFEHVKK
ncbi:FAD-dependent oxidoreductase [Mycoplasma sp. P36-A1]|uniref:FAD-dependent oxidoreductase n=1 Tax=Mycoplasma sp. P36-A1 TaxID=3252900 RepID=UPI003C2F855B